MPRHGKNRSCPSYDFTREPASEIVKDASPVLAQRGEALQLDQPTPFRFCIVESELCSKVRCDAAPCSEELTRCIGSHVGGEPTSNGIVEIVCGLCPRFSVASEDKVSENSIFFSTFATTVAYSPANQVPLSPRSSWLSPGPYADRFFFGFSGTWGDLWHQPAERRRESPVKACGN